MRYSAHWILISFNYIFPSKIAKYIDLTQDYNSEKEKYYWNFAICFTGPMLNKTLVRYLEKRAFEIAKDVKRYEILMVQTFSNTVISEYVMAEGFVI